MDLEDSSSPDEREFPGLYERKGEIENESNSSENLPSKNGKKKGKDKKEKLSYEALGGESEEDDTETKLFRSPSKSKKSKTFKFPSSKKEKREKSREPESKDGVDGTKEKKVKEDPKNDKKKSKKEKKSKSNSLTDAFELGGKLLKNHSEIKIIKSSCRPSTNIWCLSWTCC